MGLLLLFTASQYIWSSLCVDDMNRRLDESAIDQLRRILYIALVLGFIEHSHRYVVTSTPLRIPVTLKMILQIRIIVWVCTQSYPGYRPERREAESDQDRSGPNNGCLMICIDETSMFAKATSSRNNSGILIHSIRYKATDESLCAFIRR